MHYVIHDALLMRIPHISKIPPIHPIPLSFVFTLSNIYPKQHHFQNDLTVGTRRLRSAANATITNSRVRIIEDASSVFAGQECPVADFEVDDLRGIDQVVRDSHHVFEICICRSQLLPRSVFPQCVRVVDESTPIGSRADRQLTDV